MHKKNLNIAMIIDEYDEPKNGTTVSTRRFVEVLRKKHNVVVVSTGKEEPGKVTIPGFYIPFVKSLMKKNYMHFAWPDPRKLVPVIQESDIVHIQLPFYLGIKAVKIAKRFNKPVVFSFHVQPENILYNLGFDSAFLNRKIYQFFNKFSFNMADVVVCPSRYAEEELKSHGLMKPSIVISNGIVPQFDRKPVKRPKELMNKFIILSVGRISGEKCHSQLIQAVKLSKYESSIQLVIIGEGPLKERIESMGKRLSNRPVIGYMPQDELIKYYNLADLYVHPSRVELESLTVLEAMACGLTVLVSDSKTSASRQFDLDKRFIFRTRDALHLSKLIDYWYENREELRKSSQLYYKVSKKYKIEKSIKKLVSLYYSCLNGECIMEDEPEHYDQVTAAAP